MRMEETGHCMAKWCTSNRLFLPVNGPSTDHRIQYFDIWSRDELACKSIRTYIPDHLIQSSLARPDNSDADETSSNPCCKDEEVWFGDRYTHMTMPSPNSGPRSRELWSYRGEPLSSRARGRAGIALKSPEISISECRLDIRFVAAILSCFEHLYEWISKRHVLSGITGLKRRNVRRVRNASSSGKGPRTRRHSFSLIHAQPTTSIPTSAIFFSPRSAARL
jgi:hypothetical protein